MVGLWRLVLPWESSCLIEVMYIKETGSWGRGKRQRKRTEKGATAVEVNGVGVHAHLLPTGLGKVPKNPQ